MTTSAAGWKRLQMSCKGGPVSRCSPIFLTFIIAVLLTSCTQVRPKAVGEQMSQDFAAGLMRAWSEKSINVNSIQGLAKVKVRTPEKTLHGTQVLLAEKPDRLRAETLSPFGSPLLLLAADGKNLGVLLPSQNIYYTGAATAENLSRFVRLPLQVSDLISVLLYQPPLISALRETAFKLLEGGWLMVRSGKLRRQELIFNNDQQLVEVNYYDRDTLLMKVTYSQFDQDEGRFPLHFGIDLPEQEITASLEFSEPETNGTLRPGIFKLTPPPGVTIVSLDRD